MMAGPAAIVQLRKAESSGISSWRGAEALARRPAEEEAMLQMRPNCECCDADLSPSNGGAMICSFECTYCSDCANGRLGGRCPNCAGELVPRPTRAEALLTRFPASAERVTKAH